MTSNENNIWDKKYSDSLVEIFSENIREHFFRESNQEIKMKKLRTIALNENQRILILSVLLPCKEEFESNKNLSKEDQADLFDINEIFKILN